MKILLKKHELAELTGINPRTILDWTIREYLIPAEKTKGKGKTSYYNPTNIVQAKILEKLSKAGISQQKFNKLFKSGSHSDLHLSLLDPFRNTEDRMYALLIIDNCKKIKLLQYRVSLTNKSGLPKEVHEGDYETIVMINLKEIFEEVRSALK